MVPKVGNDHGDWVEEPSEEGEFGHEDVEDAGVFVFGVRDEFGF